MSPRDTPPHNTVDQNITIDLNIQINEITDDQIFNPVEHLSTTLINTLINEFHAQDNELEEEDSEDDSQFFLPRSISCVQQTVQFFYEHQNKNFCIDCLPPMCFSDSTFLIEGRHLFIHHTLPSDLLCFGCDAAIFEQGDINTCPICIETTLYIDDFRQHFEQGRETIIEVVRTPVQRQDTTADNNNNEEE